MGFKFGYIVSIEFIVINPLLSRIRLNQYKKCRESVKQNMFKWFSLFLISLSHPPHFRFVTNQHQLCTRNKNTRTVNKWANKLWSQKCFYFFSYLRSVGFTPWNLCCALVLSSQSTRTYSVHRLRSTIETAFFYKSPLFLLLKISKWSDSCL